MTKHENKLHPATIGIHGGPEYRTPGAPVVPPITQSATFHWATPADGELLYSRYGNNPNQLHVGAKAAALEGDRGRGRTRERDGGCSHDDVGADGGR